jgi:hypothetical protein
MEDHKACHSIKPHQDAASEIGSALAIALSTPAVGFNDQVEGVAQHVFACWDLNCVASSILQQQLPTTPFMHWCMHPVWCAGSTAKAANSACLA